jgi:hypothetical protein
MGGLTPNLAAGESRPGFEATALPGPGERECAARNKRRSNRPAGEMTFLRFIKARAFQARLRQGSMMTWKSRSHPMQIIS